MLVEEAGSSGRSELVSSEVAIGRNLLDARSVFSIAKSGCDYDRHERGRQATSGGRRRRDKPGRITATGRKRTNGETPVYGLDIRTLRMEGVNACGEAPGWIYGHRAAAVPPHDILVWGGKI